MNTNNPTAGRGTPVYVTHYDGPAFNAVKRYEAGWLLSVDDVTKRARVWIGAALVSVPVGNVSARSFPS
jgi:predicted polyphosphate/ATP-dependent NAD kinase